jgi:hypothetical protein
MAMATEKCWASCPEYLMPLLHYQHNHQAVPIFIIKLPWYCIGFHLCHCYPSRSDVSNLIHYCTSQSWSCVHINLTRAGIPWPYIVTLTQAGLGMRRRTLTQAGLGMRRRTLIQPGLGLSSLWFNMRWAVPLPGLILGLSELTLWITDPSPMIISTFQVNH